MTRAIRVKAFAKINLSLHVQGVRPDGYHELRTVFQSIALFDRLTIRPRPGPFELTCDDPACPTDDTNLIARAAVVAWRARRREGSPRNVAVHLQKRIPMQAGLGGGSSDAAAALRVFAQLWHVNKVQLRHFAGQIGADVPYFLVGGRVLGAGRGDRLARLPDLPRSHVVLVVPAFGVSTQRAFAWWDRDGHHGHRAPYNDLEAPVAKRHPEIARIVDELHRLGAARAAMSGSGSAVFGLFGSAGAAKTAAARIRGRRRRVEIVRTLTRTECQHLPPSEPIG
jgi:4-diphosphocytidyl-2-C-methyl-D-erythritol kinase